MAAVTPINFNELKFQHKKTRNNHHGKTRNFIRDPHKGPAEEEMGRLSQERDTDDLYNALRPFLILGKFLGLIPIEGLSQRDVDKLTFKKSSFSAKVSVIIWGILSVNVVMAIAGISRGAHKNPGDYAAAPLYLLFYSLALFVYMYFYRHAEDYIKILRKWNKMNITFTNLDTTLYHHVNLMALFVMTSAVFGDLLLTLNRLPISPPAKDSLILIHANEPQNASALQIYYIRSSKHWAALIPVHPVVTIFVFVSSKLATHAWNYLDLTVAFLSRALYHKFESLYKESARLLVVRSSSCDPRQWKQVTSDFQTLCSMVFEISTFLSPLVFCSFGLNIYFICLQLHLGLTTTPQKTLLQSTYEVWSILHLIIRVYIASICAARINDWAHRLREIFHKCPNTAYTTEVGRTERFVTLHRIGINGLGCFVVTKPIMLQLASVVLTFEIVLLQFSQTILTEPVCQCNNKTF